jgi:hypothetical protein
MSDGAFGAFEQNSSKISLVKNFRELLPIGPFVFAFGIIIF